MLCIKSNLKVYGNLDLVGLSRSLDEANLNSAILKAVLEKAQHELINDLCGERYARNKERIKRAGTARRTLITKHSPTSRNSPKNS